MPRIRVLPITVASTNSRSTIELRGGGDVVLARVQGLNRARDAVAALARQCGTGERLDVILVGINPDAWHSAAGAHPARLVSATAAEQPAEVTKAASGRPPRRGRAPARSRSRRS